VEAFAANGGKVYTCKEASLAMHEWQVKYTRNTAPGNVIDTLEANGIEPVIRSSDRSLMVQVIAGEGYQLACLNNISAARPVMNGVILSGIKAAEATLYMPYGEEKLEVKNGTVVLPEIREGGFLLLK